MKIIKSVLLTKSFYTQPIMKIVTLFLSLVVLYICAAPSNSFANDNTDYTEYFNCVKSVFSTNGINDKITSTPNLTMTDSAVEYYITKNTDFKKTVTEQTKRTALLEEIKKTCDQKINDTNDATATPPETESETTTADKTTPVTTDASTESANKQDAAQNGETTTEQNNPAPANETTTTTQVETTEEQGESEEPTEEKRTKSGLTKAESQAKIDKLQDEADAAHEVENSTENKLLGAAGIGATGIGAMQMMSGMAEQNADENAEAQMRAYLATFRCNYGGINYKGGQTGIELPGSAELLPLYTEYVTLANELKERKAGLDMRPGIESEAILDGATSGLYDDVNVGKTSGMYTSLARALSDPNGEDAKKWAEQTESAAKKKKTGMITAIAGAGASLIGNLVINRDKDDSDESDEEIAEKYSFLQTFVEDIKNLPTPNASCPDDATGTYPNCTCNSKNAVYNDKSGACLTGNTKPDFTATGQGTMSDTSSYDVSVTIPIKNMFVFTEKNFGMTKQAQKITKKFIKDLKSLDPKKCKIGIAVYTDTFGGLNDGKYYANGWANTIKKELSDHDRKLNVEYDVANDEDDFSPIVCSCADFNDQSHCQSDADRLPAIYPDCRRAVISLDCDFKNNTNLKDKLGIITGSINE